MLIENLGHVRSIRQLDFSNELAKFLDCEPCVLDDAAHRESIHWVRTRYREYSFAVRHDYVLSFSHDSKPSLLEGANGTRVGDARYLRHLYRNLNLPNVRTRRQLRYDGQILLDGIANIVERFCLGLTLRPTARKPGNGDAETFVRVLQHDFVFHRRSSVLDVTSWQRFGLNP